MMILLFSSVNKDGLDAALDMIWKNLGIEEN